MDPRKIRPRYQMGVSLGGETLILLVWRPGNVSLVTVTGDTFDLLTTLQPDPGHPAIHCNICGSVSYNLGDIQNRYCAHCHFFHQASPASGRLDGA